LGFNVGVTYFDGDLRSIAHSCPLHYGRGREVRVPPIGVSRFVLKQNQGCISRGVRFCGVGHREANFARRDSIQVAPTPRAIGMTIEWATNRRSLLKLFLLSTGAVGVISCEVGNPTREVYVLLDISGSYFPRLLQNTRDFKSLVTPLEAGDNFVMAYIQSCSFTDTARILELQMATRQAERHDQILQIDDFVENKLRLLTSTTHTDITGAIILATDYLRPSRSKRKSIIILSDMLEALPATCTRPLLFDESLLDGFTIVIANVGKSQEDNENIDKYYARLNSWTTKLQAAGAEVLIVNTMTQAADIIRRI